MKTRSSDRFFKENKAQESKKENVSVMLKRISAQELIDFRDEFFVSYEKDLRNILRRHRHGRQYYKGMCEIIEKISDDFFIAMLQGILSKNCLHCAYTVSDSENILNIQIEPWVIKLVVFSYIFDKQSSGHVALTLLNDQTYAKRVKQFIADSFSSRPEDGAAFHPFYDLEYGKLVFGCDKNYDIYKKCLPEITAWHCNKEKFFNIVKSVEQEKNADVIAIALDVLRPKSSTCSIL